MSQIESSSLNIDTVLDEDIPEGFSIYLDLPQPKPKSVISSVSTNKEFVDPVKEQIRKAMDEPSFVDYFEKIHVGDNPHEKHPERLCNDVVEKSKN